ncbi:MAG: Ig-like domain-containing protein [Synergistaceae bacterium]|nr:Ig-like domain-containing protein [Synergistaceae bacterium]
MRGGVDGSGNISNCVNAGLVSADGGDRYNMSGGIAGRINGDSNNITNCANSGSVTANGGNNNYSGGVAGAIVSYDPGARNKIEHCANSGRVTRGTTGSRNYSGGVVGHNEVSDINNCGWLVSGDINAGLNAVGSDSDSSSSYVVSLNAAQMDRVVTTVLPKERNITVSLNGRADAFASHPGAAADMSAYFSVTSSDISPTLPLRATFSYNAWPGTLEGVAEGRATLTASTAIKATSFADLNNLAPITTPLSADLSCAVTVTEPILVVVDVTSVDISERSITLNRLDTHRLNATVLPADATNQAVSWSSSNESVAAVENGLVTALSIGTATITVTTDDGGYTASCEVTVNGTPTPVDVYVTSVALSESSLTLDAGGTRLLTATVQPDNATNQAVSWSSSNESVAAVNESGLVTAVAAGTATITVTTVDGGKTASCTVTVNGTPTPAPTPSGGSSGGCAAGIGAMALLALLPLALRRRKR